MSNQLYHHGILGMKWGVRRFQNYDGSYTKKGLERYRHSKENYDTVKNKVENAKLSGDKVAVKEARGELKVAKRQLNKSYDQLALDKKADQGKELYKRGKTITDNKNRTAIIQTLVTVASVVTNGALRNAGVDFVSHGRYIPVSKLAASTIAIGGTALNAGMAIKTASQNKKLRAYYAH